MKIFLSPRRLFGLGFVVLLAANIIALLGVVSNRSGNPETLIELTERELRLPYKVREENSGLALRLVWRIIGEDEDYLSYGNWGSPVWLNAQKLTELGFSIDDTVSSEETPQREKEPLPKEVFIVLEYNGKAYQEAVKRAEGVLENVEDSLKVNREDKEFRDRFKSAKERLERERTSESRLFAIDAGLDASKLRERYSDRAQFIITPGVARLTYHFNKKKREAVGYISKISVENIYVSLKHRTVFDTILAQDKSRQYELEAPRYLVELAYGSRFEPWIRAVHKLST